MKWGVVGLGHIAHEFANAMTSVGKIYGVSSRSEEKSLAFQKQYEVTKSFKTYEDMLADPDIDVIYIASVNSVHYQQIEAALKAGKHVLCEKAIWGNYDQLKEVVAYAKEHHLILAEAMTIYHMPVLKKVKSFIEGGRLGDIKMVKADLGSLKEDDPTNRFFNKDLGGGAMLDIGTYVLSFLRYYLEGDIIAQNYTMEKYQTGVDEMWSISLKTNHDSLGNANMTFRAKLPKVAIIAGTKGYISIDNYPRADKATITYPDGKTELLAEGNSDDALLYEILDMEESIKNRHNNRMHLSESLDVVRLMDHLLTAEELN